KSVGTKVWVGHSLRLRSGQALSDAFDLDSLPANALYRKKPDLLQSTGNNKSVRPHTSLHGADSDIAANVFHARNQNVAGIEQAHRSHNVSNGLHSFHFTPESQCMQKSGIRMRCRVAELSDWISTGSIEVYSPPAEVQYWNGRRSSPLSLAVPDSGAQHLSDQQFAGSHAAGGLRSHEGLRGYLGHTRRAGLGRTLVDAGRPGGRRDWRPHECASRLGFDSPECHDLPGGGRVLLRFLRQTQPSGVQRLELPLGHVFLGGATGLWRARSHGPYRGRDYRP